MDNTVGSLTQFQKSIIIGSILGDGYLRIISGRKNAFLEINHSFKAKEYVDWKFAVLENLCLSKPKIRRGNGERLAYRFYTRQHPKLTELFRKFYQNGKKIVPKYLKLNPIILSTWFMDDGSNCGGSNFYLNTQQFTKNDQEFLIKKLSILGLQANINKDKIYYRIRFLTSSIPRLKEILRENLIPSMEYKLGYNPVETCSYLEQIETTKFL